MHGYELKQHLHQLTGHVRPVSDGALYPAISRLEKQQWIEKTQESGKVAAPRKMLTLTTKGEAELLHRLQSPSDLDISDRNRFFTILAFLKYLPPAEQRKVLLMRVQFLEGGKSFFQADGDPTSLSKEEDPFRRGMLIIAKETSQLERQWLKETIEALEA